VISILNLAPHKPTRGWKPRLGGVVIADKRSEPNTACAVAR